MANLAALRQSLRERGDAEAVTSVTRGDAQRFSAEQVAEKAFRFANGLPEHGYSPGDRIAFIAENSPELIAALLGVMTSGCIAVPIDVQMEQETTKTVLKDCGAQAVLTSTNRVDRLAELLDQDGPATACTSPAVFPL